MTLTDAFPLSDDNNGPEYSFELRFDVDRVLVCGEWNAVMKEKCDAKGN